MKLFSIEKIKNADIREMFNLDEDSTRINKSETYILITYLDEDNNIIDIVRLDKSKVWNTYRKYIDKKNKGNFYGGDDIVERIRRIEMKKIEEDDDEEDEKVKACEDIYSVPVVEEIDSVMIDANVVKVKEMLGEVEVE